MRLFLDTSAFAKRYVAERGTDRVLELCNRAQQLAVSIICLPEMFSTLNRLLREKKLNKVQYSELKKKVIADLSDADLCEITTVVMGGVIAILESSPLRAMDAIHVASAAAYKADVFVSADRRQLAAAKKIKLFVVDVA